MSATIYGSVNLAAKPISPTGYDISVGADGSCTATVTTTIPASGFTIRSLPQYGSPHPDFPTLLLWETKASREAGSLMKVISTYKGVANGNTRQQAVVEFALALTQDPILTHPKFCGNPSADLGQSFPNPKINGGEIAAIDTVLKTNAAYTKNSSFIVQAKFNGDAPDIGAIGSTHKSTQVGRLYYMLKRQGIESYLSVGGSYKQSYVDTVIAPDIYNFLGKVIPASANPSIGNIQQCLSSQKRNLLYNSLSWRVQGNLVTISQDYQMSGIGGWNAFLYLATEGDPSALTANDITQAGADA